MNQFPLVDLVLRVEIAPPGSSGLPEQPTLSLLFDPHLTVERCYLPRCPCAVRIPPVGFPRDLCCLCELHQRRSGVLHRLDYQAFTCYWERILLLSGAGALKYSDCSFSFNLQVKFIQKNKSLAAEKRRLFRFKTAFLGIKRLGAMSLMRKQLLI
jgi:hypothetical protein